MDERLYNARAEWRPQKRRSGLTGTVRCGEYNKVRRVRPHSGIIPW